MLRRRTTVFWQKSLYVARIYDFTTRRPTSTYPRRLMMARRTSLSVLLSPSLVRRETTSLVQRSSLRRQHQKNLRRKRPQRLPRPNPRWRPSPPNPPSKRTRPSSRRVSVSSRHRLLRRLHSSAASLSRRSRAPVLRAGSSEKTLRSTKHLRVRRLPRILPPFPSPRPSFLNTPTLPFPTCAVRSVRASRSRSRSSPTTT